jgi:hypothetical protein
MPARNCSMAFTSSPGKPAMLICESSAMASVRKTTATVLRCEMAFCRAQERSSTTW